MAVLSDFIPLTANDSQSEVGHIDKASDFKLPDVNIGPGLGTQKPQLADFIDNEQSSLANRMEPERFDWQEQGMGKFAGSPHIKELGDDPYLGQQFNENRFAQAQSGWEETKRGLEGFGVGFGQGFAGMITNLKNIGSWFTDPTLQSSFKQDQLEELNKKQQEFDNNYHIFQGDDPTVWSRVMKDVQETGPLLGSIAEIVAVSALTGGIAGAIEGAEVGTAEAEGVTELGLGASPELIANSNKIAETIAKGTTPNLWKGVAESASKAVSKVPIPFSGTAGFLTDAGTYSAEGGAAATTVRGFAAFVNDLSQLNMATAFASGNAAATYQQSVNDQVENYKKSHDGQVPGFADMEGFKDRAMKSAKVDGAMNAYSMLLFEKIGMNNLFNSRSTLQEAIEKSGRGIYDRVGVKSTLFNKTAAEEPLYLKQQTKWYDFKSNLFDNSAEGLRNIGIKGVEFGAISNIMSGIDKGVKSYFDAKYDNKDVDVFDAIKTGIDSQFTKEGAGTFISSFLQGALVFGIGGAALSRIKDAGINKWNGVTDAGQRLGDIDAQNFVQQVNAAWKDPLNPVKETIHDMILQNAVGEGSKSALADGDRKAFHDFADDNQRIFLMKLVKNGLADAWVDKAMQKARTLDQEDLNKFMGFTGEQNTPENYQAIKAQINELPGRVRDLRNIRKYIDTKLPNPFNPYVKDPTTGKRLFADGSDEFRNEYNNRQIYEVAKDYVSTMKDVAEMALVRQNKLLNGAEGTTGILDMPFAKNLGFSDIFTLTSTELLDKQISLYASTMKNDAESMDKLKTLTDYREQLTDYLKGYADILNEGSAKDRAQRLKALDEKHKDKLSDAMYDYLETTVVTKNLNGKVIDRKTPPGKQEVIDATEKMMDYYKLGVDHHAMLHQLNVLLDPNIVKRFGMSVMQEANKRQREAQGNAEGVSQEEVDLMAEHRKLTSDIADIKKTGVVAETRANAQKVKQMQDRIDVINKHLEEIRNPKPEETTTDTNTPPPTPKSTRTSQELELDRNNIKDFYKEDKDIEAKTFTDSLNAHPDLKTLIGQVQGIYGDKPEQLDKQRDKMIDEYFDKLLNTVTPKDIEFGKNILGHPQVVESDGRYFVQANDKKVTESVSTIAEANRQLSRYLNENHPTITDTDFRVGQMIYEKSHGNEFVIKGLDKKDGYVVLKDKDAASTISVPTDELKNDYVSDIKDINKPEETSNYTPFNSSLPKMVIPDSLVSAGIHSSGGPGTIPTDVDKETHTQAILSVPHEVWSTGEGLTLVVKKNPVVANDRVVVPGNPQILQKGQEYSVQLAYNGQVLPEYLTSSSYITIAPDGTTKTMNQLTPADVGALFQLTPKYSTNELMRQHLIETEQDNQKLQQLAKEVHENGEMLNMEGKIQITHNPDYNFIKTGETGAKLSDIQDLQHGKHGLKMLIIDNNDSTNILEDTFDDPQERDRAMSMFNRGLIGQPSMSTVIAQHSNGIMMSYQLIPRQQISPEETDELVKAISGLGVKSTKANMQKADDLLNNLFIALPKYIEGWKHLDRVSVKVMHIGKGKADDKGEGGSHLFVRVYYTPEKDSNGERVYFDNGGLNIQGEKGQIMKFDSIDELLDKLNTQLEKATIKLPKLTIDNLKYQPGNYPDMESNVHANSIKGVSTTYHIPDSNGSNRIQKSKPDIPQRVVTDNLHEDSEANINDQLLEALNPKPENDSIEDELAQLDRDDAELLKKLTNTVNPTIAVSNSTTITPNTSVLNSILLDARHFINKTSDIAEPKLQSNGFDSITNVDSAQVVPTSISIRRGERTDGTIYNVYLPSGKAIQLTRDITAETLLGIDSKKYLSYDKAVEAIMDKYKDTYNPLSADNRQLYTQIEDKSARTEWLKQLRELHSVFSKPENRKQIKDDINTNLRIAGIRDAMDREGFDDYIEEYGQRNSDNQFKNKSSIGGMESLGSSIKRYIASTVIYLPDVERTDELDHQYHADGTPIIQAADTGFIYNGMLKLLSGSPDENKVLDRIINYIGNENNPDTTGYLCNLLKESGFNIDKYTQTGEWECATLEGANMFNATMKGFMQIQNDYYNTIIDPNNNETFVVNANADGIERTQFRNWSNGFQVKYQNKLQQEKSDSGRNKIYKEAARPLEKFIAETGTTAVKNRFVGGDKKSSDNALTELSSSISRDFYNSTCIKLSSNYIAQSIIATKDPQYRTELQQKTFNMYPTDVLDPIEVRTQFLDYLKTYKNLFTRPEGVTEATIPEKWLLKTAKQNAPYDQSINEMSHKNNKGEDIYNFRYRNYNADAVELLNDNNHLDKLRNDPDTQGSFLLTNPDFLLMNKKLNLVGGISLKRSYKDEETGEREIISSEKNKDGIDFSDYGGKEYLITILSQYDISKQPGVEIKRPDGTKFIATNISLGPVGNKASHPMIPLPVIHSIEKTTRGWKTSDEVRDIIFNMVSDDIDRVVRNKQNTEGTIEGYHTDEKRGEKLWRTSWLLDTKLHDADEETIGQELEKLAGTEGFDIEDKRTEIIAAAEKILRKELADLKDKMKSLDLISDRNENILLSAYLYKGVGKTKDDKVNLIPGDFDYNLAQVVINQLVNYIGATQLLYGDESKRIPNPTQLWKRRAGYNGDGPSLNNRVSVPGTDIKPVTIFKGVTIPDDVDKADDGQMRGTVKFFRSQLLAQGKLTEFKSAILDKLEAGKPLDKKESKEMLKLKTAINPQKVVYEDGKTYLKSTVMTLLREDTSYRIGNQWKALPGRERNHELLNKMDEQENKGHIALAYPVSVSKGVKENVAPSIEGISDTHFQDLQAKMMRMQVEIIPGKEKGAKPVQPAAQLLAEQDLNKLLHVDGEWKKTSEVIQDYMDAVQQRKTNNAISAISELFTSDKPITDLNKLPELTPNMDNFMDRAVDTLLATGADSQTIELFREHFNINLPSSREKAIQILLANLVKGVTKETVPLWSMTAMSDSGFSVIRHVTETDANGLPVYSRCPIIPMSEFKKDPKKYSEYPYISDTAKDVIPMIDDTGKTLFYYTEGLRSLLTNDEINDNKFTNEFEYGLFSRTPGTGPHSNGVVRWVDNIAVSHNTSCILPRKVMERTGNDMDGDVFYVQRFDTYMNGKDRISYGTAGSDSAKFYEYKRWLLDNNRSVQKLYHGDKLYSGEEATATLLGDNEVNEYRLDQVLKDLKLPSTIQEFVKRGGDKLNNGVQTNKALKAQMALLSGEHVSGGGEYATINQNTSTEGVIAMTKTLINYFREPVDGKVSEQAEKIANQLEDKGTDPNSLIGQVQAFEMNKGGSQEVGAVANLIQVRSVLNQFNAKIQKGFGYEFDSKTLYNYGTTKTLSGLSVSHQIDALAQMILDGDKTHLNTRFGLNTEFDGYIANMIGLGQDLDTALLYPLTYVWKTYAKLTSRGISKDISPNSDRVLDNMIKGLEGKKAVSAKLTHDKLLEHLRNGVRDFNVELSLLQNLKQMKKLHEVMRAMAKISTLDTGRNISSVENIEDIQKAYDDLGIGMTKEQFEQAKIPIDVRDIVTKKSGNFAVNYKIFKIISDTVLPKYLLSKSEPFINIKSIIRKNFKVPRNDSLFDKKLDYNLNSYLSLVPYINTLSGDERDTLDQKLIWNNSDSPRSVVSILQNAKDLLTDENTNYALNNFLNIVLKDSKKGVNINQIMSNTWTRIGEQQQAKIVGAIVDMIANTDPDIHKAGMAIYNYLIVRDGGQFKSGSYMRFIPTFMMRGWSDSMDKTVEMLAKTDIRDDFSFDQHFKMTYPELAEKAIMSYVTHINNMQYLPKYSIGSFDNYKLPKDATPEMEQELNKFNSLPIYTDSKTDSIVIDMFKDIRQWQDQGEHGYVMPKGKFSDIEREKLKKNLVYGESAGFTNVGKGLEFPFAINRDNKIYILQKVGREQPGTLTGLLQHDEELPIGMKATYMHYTGNKGDRKQWEMASALLGEPPLTEEQKQQLNEDEPSPVSTDIKQASKQGVLTANINGRTVKIDENTGQQLDVSEKPVVPSQSIDWKTEIDKLSTGKPEGWLDEARNLYKSLVGRIPDSEILDKIKNCL